MAGAVQDTSGAFLEDTLLGWSVLLALGCGIVWQLKTSGGWQKDRDKQIGEKWNKKMIEYKQCNNRNEDHIMDHPYLGSSRSGDDRQLPFFGF